MKKLWFLLAIPAVLLLWWAADRKESVPSVHFATVKRETLDSIISTNGKLEPVDYAAVRAEIAGVARTVAIERGQKVTEGQTLVMLDDAAERAALDTARAQWEEAKAEAATVQQGGKLSLLTDYAGRLQAAQLTLADAKRRMDSVQRLYAKQAATEQELMAAKSAAAAAQQQVESIENSRKTLVAPSDRSTSLAKLEDAKAGLELAQHRLSLTVIRSPMTGIAYQFDIKRGTYLEVGAPVATVGNLNQMRVRVYVDEPDLGRVALNLPVEITWEARAGQHWQGRVTQTPTEIETLGSRQVGVVVCVIDNPNHELLPGTNIDANIISKVVQNAISIPKQALQTTSSQGSGVWKLVDGDRVQWQPVTAGISTITSVEIKSGLREGDRVILPSDATMANGMRVKPLVDQTGQTT
jgi:HlyD family secretion protein